MTIINPHNVRQLYFTWIVLLLVAIGLAVGSYYLTKQAFIPLLAEPSSGQPWLIGLLIYCGVAWILALLFKYSFRRPMITWGLFTSLAVVGVGLTVLLDWNSFSIIVHAVAVGSLLSFGPYLHFE